MSIKLTLESPVRTLEQFDEIFYSYKTQNVICGVCNPMNDDYEWIVEHMRNYFSYEYNVGISRIRFYWENIFTRYKLESTDIGTALEMVNRYFIGHDVLYGLFRKDNDLVIEFFIHPAHVTEFTIIPVSDAIMQHFALFLNTYAEMSHEAVYCGSNNQFMR